VYFCLKKLFFSAICLVNKDDQHVRLHSVSASDVAFVAFRTSLQVRQAWPILYKQIHSESKSASGMFGCNVFEVFLRIQHLRYLFAATYDADQPQCVCRVPISVVVY